MPRAAARAVPIAQGSVLRGLAPRGSRLPAAPAPLTSLIGRDRELEELAALLPACRLLTLTGSGGAGKTRLAAELVRRSARPVVWVELASLGSPDLVAHQTLSALGGRSSGQSLAIESVISEIADAPLLLVLDNCEHLIEGCSLFARAVLHSCPQVALLATSREALGVAGEQVWTVPPLALPPAAGAVDASGAAAVVLFLERARAAAPRFELDERNAAAVEEICRRVDGLPLAIELAAARVRALTPEEIARRLGASFDLLASRDRGVDARHRTLEATLDWSWRLLDDDERLLLGRLAVFAGGFSIRDAERICACCGITGERALGVLLALVDKSLVLAEPLDGTCRYRLLQTVRDLVWSRQEPACAASLRELHAHLFLELVEEAEPHLFGGAASAVWGGRLEAELSNLRAAIDWALEEPCRQAPARPEDAAGAVCAQRPGDPPGRVEVALRMGASLHWFWFARGRLREGRRVLARALEAAAGASSSPGQAIAAPVRARALVAFGQVAIWQADFEAVRPAMETAVSLLESGPEDDFWRAYALAGLGIARTLEGEATGTLPLIDESVDAARRHRHSVLLPFALYWRARVRGLLGDLAGGLEDVAEAIAISRRQGHRPAIGHCLGVEANLLLAAGEDERAATSMGESLAVHLETEDHWGLARVLEDLGRLALRRARPDSALTLFACAERLRQALGSPRGPGEREAVEPAVAACRERLAPAEIERCVTAGGALGLDQIADLATAIIDGAPAGAPLHPSPAPREDGRQTAGKVRSASGTEKAPITPRPAPVALAIRTLGVGELRVEGARVEGLWGRPWELLALLGWNRQGLRREDVGLALWPDASPEKLRNLFHVTLHRLRRTMGGREWIVRDGERYLLSPAIAWELDARRFESEVAAALRELRAGRDAAGALQEALALYQGDFLAAETAGDWHLEIRERLREQWLEGLRELARFHAGRGRHAEAADALRRLTAADPVDEDASRELIGCALRLGERGEALREYQRLERALERELGVEPAPETVALYRELRGGGPRPVSAGGPQR